MNDFKLRLNGNAIVLIDWSNIRNQQNKLGWNIDLEKLYQWLISHEEINKIQFFYGYENNEKSKKFLKKVQSFGYEVITKEVKYLNIFLENSNFKEKAKKIDSLIEDLNWPIASAMVEDENGNEIDDERIINEDQKIELEEALFNIIKEPIEIPKCDFDVEITTEIMKHFDDFQTIILLSGDGDFAYPIEECLKNDKQVVIISGFKKGKWSSIGKEIWNLKWNLDLKSTRKFPYPQIINLLNLDFIKISRQPKLTG